MAILPSIVPNDYIMNDKLPMKESHEKVNMVLEKNFNIFLI